MLDHHGQRHSVRPSRPFLRSRQRVFVTSLGRTSLLVEFSRTTGAKGSISGPACTSQAGRLGHDRSVQRLGRPPACAWHDVPEHLGPADDRGGRLSPSGALRCGLSFPEHGNGACGFALARRRRLYSHPLAGVRAAVDRAVFSVTTSAVARSPSPTMTAMRARRTSAVAAGPSRRSTSVSGAAVPRKALVTSANPADIEFWCDRIEDGTQDGEPDAGHRP